jgi:hypothetical protein
MKPFLLQFGISIIYTIAILIITNNINSDGGGKGYAIFFFLLMIIGFHLVITFILIMTKTWTSQYIIPPIIVLALLFLWVSNS